MWARGHASMLGGHLRASAVVAAPLLQYAALSLKMLGHRCEQEKTTAKCKQDLNAGTLFTLLANDLGTRSRPLLLDLDPGKEVRRPPRGHPQHASQEAPFQMGSRVCRAFSSEFVG